MRVYYENFYQLVGHSEKRSRWLCYFMKIMSLKRSLSLLLSVYVLSIYQPVWATTSSCEKLLHVQDPLAPLLSRSNSELSRQIPQFSRQIADKLIHRIDEVKLFAHSYAFTRNITHGDFTAYDLLDFASSQGLAGIHIHFDFLKKTTSSRTGFRDFADYAKSKKLSIVLEVSETSKLILDEAIEAAVLMNIKTIRFYPIKTGPVSEVIDQVVEDLRYASSHHLVKEFEINLLLEQHEDLRSKELIEILRRVNSSQLGLLFDFTNMVPSFEHPLEALATQAPHIRAVHINDIIPVVDGSGFGKIGVVSGSGAIPIKRMMYELLLLENPITFSLEEEVGYVAPAFRFPEESDTTIPLRSSSETPIVKNQLQRQLKQEHEDAINQVKFIRIILAELRAMAIRQLSYHKPLRPH